MNARGWMFWTVALFVCVGIAAEVRSAGQAPSESAAPDARQTVSGSITSLNASARRVQVTSPDGQVVTLSIAPSATVMQNGRAIPIEDLQVGQQVTIRQTEQDGANMASTIEVTQASSAPGASSSSSPASPGGLPRTSSSAGSATTTASPSSSPSSSAPSSGLQPSSTTAGSAGTSADAPGSFPSQSTGGVSAPSPTSASGSAATFPPQAGTGMPSGASQPLEDASSMGASPSSVPGSASGTGSASGSFSAPSTSTSGSGAVSGSATTGTQAQ